MPPDACCIGFEGETYFIRYPNSFKVDDVEGLMRDKTTRFRNYLGLNGPQTIEFMYGLGSVTTGNGRIITVIGKLDGTKRVKDQFGNFTHIEVGENASGVNFFKYAQYLLEWTNLVSRL